MGACCGYLGNEEGSEDLIGHTSGRWSNECGRAARSDGGSYLSSSKSEFFRKRNFSSMSDFFRKRNSKERGE
jgi:hypothetical protein